MNLIECCLKLLIRGKDLSRALLSLPGPKKYLCSGLIIILLALAGSRCYAQYTKKQIDSLFNIANWENDLDLGVKKALTAYHASKAIGYQEGEMKGLLTCAIKYSNAKHFEDGFRYAVEADSITEALGEPRYISILLIIKGNCYSNLGFYKDGEETLLGAVAVAESIKDPDRRHERLGFLYTALGHNIELSKGDMKKFSFYSQKAYSEYQMIKEPKKFPYVATIPVCNYGEYFMTLKQYDSAEFYFKKAIKLCKANEDDITMGFTCSLLGNLYYEKKNYQASKINYKEAIRLLAAAKVGNDLKEAYVGLSKV